MSANLNSKLLHADQLYNSIGLALTNSANFFINYVVFQVLRFCPLILCMQFLVTMPYAIRCALWPEGGSIIHQALILVTLEYICSDVPFRSVCSRGVICKHGAMCCGSGVLRELQGGARQEHRDRALQGGILVLMGKGWMCRVSSWCPTASLRPRCSPSSLSCATAASCPTPCKYALSGSQACLSNVPHTPCPHI
jgi:hypothetical protein